MSLPMVSAEIRGLRAERPVSRLSVYLASSRDEIDSALALRYEIFAHEFGAEIAGPRPGIDEDEFDAHCGHLLVRDDDRDEVVGTYRILTPERAAAAGRYYSQGEFDLARVLRRGRRVLEVGRSCVHPDHRNGATIALLWQGLAQFMQSRHYEYMIGCASISMVDGGHGAASIYNSLRQASMSPIEYRVFPRYPLPLERLDDTLDTALPPLIKGYVRCGAWVCGDPAWDPDFNTADLLMLLPMSRLDRRYARHFMKHDQ